MSSVNYLFTAVPCVSTLNDLSSQVFFLCGDCSSFCHVEDSFPPPFSRLPFDYLVFFGPKDIFNFSSSVISPFLCDLGIVSC